MMICSLTNFMCVFSIGANIQQTGQSVYKVFHFFGQMVYYKDHATISKSLIFNELSSLAQGSFFGRVLDYMYVTLQVSML